MTILGPAALQFCQGKRGIHWIPSFVDNVGTAWLSYDSASGIGTDSAQLEIVACLRNLDGRAAATARIVHIPGARVDMYFGADHRLNVNLSSTGGALVTWQSTNDAAGTIGNDAGEWEIRARADLGGTPTFEVLRRGIVGGVATAWTAVTGAFSAGPTTGTIDSARGGQAGNEVGILATNAGANINDCHLGYFWWQSGALQDEDAFGANGERFDPATVGTPDLLIRGPASAITTDIGTGAKTLTVTGGPFVDV